MTQYAEQHGYENIEHYTDDGWTGTNFDRPDWKRMLADIEAGKVGTVIVKDMSRIGRDYLQVGFYTEVMFREKGVHFIAISNGVDSERRESAEFAPFLNIMNVLFCFSTIFANGVKAHSIAKAPVTVSLRERRLQVLFLFRCCL